MIDFSRIFKIINGTKGSFVLTLLSKWYFWIAIPAMYTAYKALVIIDKLFTDYGVYDSIKSNIQEISQKTEECLPLIYDIERFFNCL